MGGLSTASVLQGIGDLLQMEQILGPKEWSDTPSVVQVARIKATIGKCPIDFGNYSANPSYNDDEARWWEEVGLIVAQDIATKLGKKQGNMVPSKYSKEVAAAGGPDLDIPADLGPRLSSSEQRRFQ